VSGWACSTDRLGSSCERLLLLARVGGVSWRLVFVTFEGADGSGKSTQAELLRAALAADGRDVVLTREPGGTELGEGVRALVLNGPTMGAWAEAALFAASRAEHVEEVIRPALERGADVVCDRYVDSSLAYQGIARGLGVEAVLELNLAVTGGLLPDVTFLLLVDPRVATGRHVEPDRLEREGEQLQARVDAAYRELAVRFPDRIVTIDATGRPDEIAKEVRERLRDRS
jgi:dTMP kinase